MPPVPTHIFRIVHIDNLPILLASNGLHAPNFQPDDGLVYRTIHNSDIQARRHVRAVPCGPGGVIHDYVSFYFGRRSPMLYQLHTGWVQGYNEGQEPVIYLVSSVQRIVEAGCGFVFSDGHGIAAFTNWFADLADLDQVDWPTVETRSWRDTEDDPDRQRRKQAEFLVHRFVPWTAVAGIAVLNDRMKERVETILRNSVTTPPLTVIVRPAWYY